jgi:hypothetical protein
MKSLAHVLLMTGAAMALATVHHPTPAAALNATSSIDARLRLDWDVGTGHGGRPRCASWSRHSTPLAR